MATIFGSNGDNTLIVEADDLRGLAGNDTYVVTNALANNPANAGRVIVINDTEGANRLQFADGLQITSVQFLGGNAIQVTLTNNIRIQVVGANAFTFDIGGNSAAGDSTGLLGRSFTQLASDLGVTLVNGAGTTAAPVTIQPGAAPLAPPTPPYTVTANAPTIAEGNAGNSTLSFQLTLDRPATETVTLNVATNGGSASAGADFIPFATTVTFAVGQNTAFVNVAVVGDTIVEANETVQLSITGSQLVAPVTATGTITNDDTAANAVFLAPSTSAVSVNEGQAVTFTIQTQNVATGTLLSYAITGSANSADIGNAPLTGTTVVGANGQATVTVNTVTDNLTEGAESLVFSYTNPITLASAGSVTTTINDTSVTPQSFSLTSSAPTVVEGNAGTTVLSYTLTLNQSPLAPVTVNVAIDASSTATAGVDFAAPPATVVFAVGQTQAIVNVTVNGDVTFEPNETVVLSFSGAQLTGAFTGTGTITNDDTDPAITPQTLTLSAGLDTANGAGGNDTIVANTGTFQANDVINGGGNTGGAGNRIVINGPLADQQFTNTSNIQTVEYTNSNAPGTVPMVNAAPDTLGVFAANAGVRNLTLTVQSDINATGFNQALAVTGSIDADAFQFNVTDNGVKTVDLGANVPNTFDRVIADGVGANGARISFVSGEVGNGSSLNTTAPSAVAGTAYNGQAAGGLAVRLEQQSATFNVTGEAGDDAASPAHRFEDEGVIFTGTTFNVRDVANAAINRGNFEAVILGTNGADVVDATTLGFAAGDDVYINAGAGNDTLTDSANADFLVGGAGDDVLNTTAGNDSALGGANNDTITATTGDDSLDGGANNDRISFAAAGIDGNDTVIGGADTDTLVINDAAIADAVFGNKSTLEVLELGAVGTVATLDTLAYAAGIASVLGSTGADTINTFDSTAGARTLSVNGGDGVDTVNVNDGPGVDSGFTLNVVNVENVAIGGYTNSTVNINDATGTAVLGHTFAAFGGETVNGGAGNDSYTARSNSLTNVFNGNGGNDTLTVAAGNAATVTGVETITVNAAGRAVATDSTAAVVTLVGGASVTAGGGADTINLSAAGNDNVDAGLGNDTVVAGANLDGNDTINGGGGTNVLSIAQVGTLDAAFTNTNNIQTLVLLTTGAAGSTVTLDTEAFDAGIATVNGSANLAPLATGASTNDTINVVAGAATRTLTIDGGEITANNDTDTVTVTGNGNVVLNTTNVEVVNGGALVGNLTVTASGTQAVAITGNAGTDSLTGGDGNDTITGGDGKDTMAGGLGNDTYVMSVTQFNTDLDTINEAVAGGAADVLRLTSVNAAENIVDVGFNNRFTNLEVAEFVGAPTTFTAQLGSFASLTGLRTFTAGTNATLNLTYTADFTGNVTINGGAGADTVAAAAINGTVNFVDSAAGGNDNVTTGAFADTVTLNDGNNTVVTNAGNDTVRLGAGVDNVNTGANDDTVNVGFDGAFASTITDADIVVAGTGADILNIQGNTVLSGANQFSGFETVNLLSQGSANGNGGFSYSLTIDNDNAGTGNLVVNAAGLLADADPLAPVAPERLNLDASAVTGFAVSVTGGAAADLIFGGTQADTLIGGSGADTLIGGGGSDAITLNSDGATDTIALRGLVNAIGLDNITGFDRVSGAQDRIALDASLFTGALSFASVAQGGVVSANNVFNVSTTVPGGVGSVSTQVQVASFLQTNNFGPSVAGDAKVFFLTDGTDTYAWAYVSDGLANVNASEFTNIAILRGVTSVAAGNVVLDVQNGPFTTLNDTRTLTAAEVNSGVAFSDGLSGNDQLTLADASAPVTLTNVETINGSGGNDTITSTTAATISGGMGDDVLTGAAGGNDNLTGGGGSDLFSVTGGTDVVNDLNGIGVLADDLTVVFGATANATVTAAFTAEAQTFNAGTANLSSAGFNVDLTLAGVGNGFTVTNTAVGPVTFTGSNQNDTLTGNAGMDILLGGNGADVLDGAGGNDALTGGAGADVFNITAGVDTVSDLSGADANSDALVVAAGATVNATLSALYNNDNRSSNAGIANLTTNGFNVFLEASTGPSGYTVTNTGGAIDVIASLGKDTLLGGAAGDRLAGHGGDDSLVGGAGVDVFDGIDAFLGNNIANAAGNDTFTGAGGNDTFNIGGGIDVVTDLSGNDNILIAAASTLNATVTAVFVASNASNNNGTANLTTFGFDVDLSADTTGSTAGYRVTNTNGAAATTILGSDFAGTPGAGDTLIGAGGIDVLSGFAGDDSLQGNAGDDMLDGGAGTDTIDGGAGLDMITGGLGNDSLTGGANDDTFMVDSGTDTITDLSDADILQVSGGATANATVTAAYVAGLTTVNNGTASLTTNGFAVNVGNAGVGNGFTITNTGSGVQLRGSNNADTITGGDGIDTIISRDGADVVSGGMGNDLLQNNNANLSSGNDIISGGAGADTIVLADANDANNSSERVRYDSVDDISAAGGAAEVDTVMFFDTDGNGTGNDLIVFGTTLRAALDDNASAALNFGATNGVDGGNDVIGTAGNEATVLNDLEVEINVTAFTEPGLVSLLGELNEEIDFSGIATGQEHLFVVNVSGTQAGLVYYVAANGGDDVITANELRIVGVVTHNDGVNLAFNDFAFI